MKYNLLKEQGMDPKQFNLPAYYILQIFDQITSMSTAHLATFKQTELAKMQFGDPLQSVSYPVFHDLVLSGLNLEPAIGLRVGERLRVNSHGILGYAAMNSGTIRQAAELFEHYLKTRTTLLSARHEIDRNELRFIFEEPFALNDIRRPVMEAMVLTIKNMFDYIAMGTSYVDCIFFSFDKPDYAALAQDLFHSEVRYGQSWTGFTFPMAIIDLPLKMADAAMFKEAAQICQHALDKLNAQQSLSSDVKRIMLDINHRFSSLDVIAQLCHLTPRTLHRHLQDEGTSYKQLLEEVRHTLALEHLKAEELTIQEISYLLGYSDMANFRRAFKKWESVSPSEYRATHL